MHTQLPINLHTYKLTYTNLQKSFARIHTLHIYITHAYIIHTYLHVLTYLLVYIDTDIRVVIHTLIHAYSIQSFTLCIVM